MNADDSEVWRATVESADRERLTAWSREGARIVGLDVVDGAAQLRMERRPGWSLPPPAPPSPRLDVAIERWEPPLPSEVLAAVEHIHTTVFGEPPGDGARGRSPPTR